MKDFLSKKDIIAVVGVSKNKEKYGWIVFKELKDKGYNAFPVNPKYDTINGFNCYKSIKEIQGVTLIVCVVKPLITEEVVKQCKKLGVNKVWMQPGSESEKAISFCKKNNIRVIHNSCIIIKELKKRE